jgi:nucleoid-associated protein YgaU
MGCQLKTLNKKANLTATELDLRPPTKLATEEYKSEWGWKEKTAFAVLHARGDRKLAKEKVTTVFKQWAKEDPVSLKRFVASNKDIVQKKLAIFLKFPTHKLSREDLKLNRQELEVKLRNFLNEQSDLSLVDHQVNVGETLQTISFDRYWTTRRWTEIYLLNSTDIKDWNVLNAGQVLKVVQHLDTDSIPVRTPASPAKLSK